jgi:hypothetical protein
MRQQKQNRTKRQNEGQGNGRLHKYDALNNLPLDNRETPFFHAFE